MSREPWLITAELVALGETMLGYKLDSPGWWEVYGTPDEHVRRVKAPDDVSWNPETDGIAPPALLAAVDQWWAEYPDGAEEYIVTPPPWPKVVDPDAPPGPPEVTYCELNGWGNGGQYAFELIVTEQGVEHGARVSWYEHEGAHVEHVAGREDDWMMHANDRAETYWFPAHLVDLANAYVEELMARVKLTGEDIVGEAIMDTMMGWRAPTVEHPQGG